MKHCYKFGQGSKATINIAIRYHKPCFSPKPDYEYLFMTLQLTDFGMLQL